MAAALALACSGRSDAGAAQLPTAKIVVGNHQVEVEVADTPETRSRGLMFRQSLPADAGMLFVFPSDGLVSFTMATVPDPLEIVFFDAAGRVVDRLHMDPCSGTDSTCVAYTPRGPFRYALETGDGYVVEAAFRIGDKINPENGSLLGFDLLGLGQSRLSQRFVLHLEHRRLGHFPAALAAFVGFSLFDRQLGLRRRVQLLTSPATSMPLTFGAWQPVLLIPAEAVAWPA